MQERSDTRSTTPYGDFMPGSLMEMWPSGIDTAARSFGPFWSGMARYNLEAMGLVARRTRACLEMPAKAAQCRTPQDVMALQMQFWQTAAHDYSQGASRMMAALTSCAGPGMANPFGMWTNGAADRPQPRDYITFQEPQAPVRSPGEPTPPRAPGAAKDRRAA